MKINVKVIPKASRNAVVEEKDILKVYTTSPPADGRANKSVIAQLADYYGVRKSDVEIIKGLKSRLKTISIHNNI